MRRRDLIDVALGHAPADVLVRGGTLVNVCTSQLYPADVAIKGDRIAAVGDSLEHAAGPDTRHVDAAGRFLVPGLVDGHLHHCHSALGVTEFAEGLLSHGVTATADGFYGPAIVGGIEAVRALKDAFDPLPIRLVFLVPVLAWIQNRETGLTPAASVSLEDMHEMLEWEGCHGLEEPSPAAVKDGFEGLLDLFEATLAQRKVITGHAAGLDERMLQAYVATGVTTDHEAVSRAEALAKARLGLVLLARQGDPGCEDVPEVVRAHTESGASAECFGMCSDLAAPLKLVDEGTVDHGVRVAIARGVAPLKAIQMATLNTAEALGAELDIGSIAPGRFADLLLVDDLAELSIREVMVGGEAVVRDGELVRPLPPTTYPDTLRGTVRVAAPLTPDDFTVRVDPGPERVEVRVIEVSEEGSLLTSPERRARLAVTGEVLEPDVDADVLTLANVDRLGKGTGIGLGFAQGFGLKRGAFASTVTAVTMNLVVVGADAGDMAVAANRVVELGGGRVVVDRGEIVAEVALPILGLHSDAPLDQVIDGHRDAVAAIAGLGCSLRDPFSQLEFCFSCQDIGDLKLSEEGLVDVARAERVDLVTATS
jgi:adenine deaminase